MLGGQQANRTLGKLTLRPHQLTAVSRLLEVIASHRGALLADAVGLGKTYVALAVARELGSALVICPAALRAMWERAMKTAQVELPIVTIESLSRGRTIDVAVDLLIVDEAHHLRTPSTRRYATLARHARRSRVLLLSATPLHNSRRDLESVLALFAGSAVKNWKDAALARLIVRRDEALSGQELPAVSGPHSLETGVSDDCLDAILALPPAVPAADEGVAHALSTISLLHLWSSSRAALVASMRKRLARAVALRDAIAGGHLPTASELAAWAYDGETLQLAFPLFTPTRDVLDQAGLNAQLDLFAGSARKLLDLCRTTPDPDEARVALLRSLRARHDGSRIVAFSQYAHTITGLGRLMRDDPRVAIVTAAGARIASGSLPREEVLAQFNADAPFVRPVERIELLLTTDLLSEGIDLRGAAVIVHLDLPWNPARLEQRVGRTRRLGSRLREIHVYMLAPPAAAERLLELRRRLADKVKTARVIIGGSFDPFGGADNSESPVSDGEALRSRMRDWQIDGRPSDGNTAIGAARAHANGWIAAVIVHGMARLIGDLGAGVTDDARLLGSTLHQMGAAIPVDGSRWQEVSQSIAEWISARNATAGTERRSPAQRAVLDRLADTVARAPRHRRSAMIVAAQRTRATLANMRGIGAERVLAQLAHSPDDDASWLASVDAFDLQPTPDTLLQADRIVGVILLERIRDSADATPG